MPLNADERDELRASVRALLERESSSERVRAAITGPGGFDAALSAQMVELGWTSIHVPERHGGAGAGYADLGIVVHELGRAITPAPFLASAVLASSALARSDNHSVADGALRALVSGEARGSVALASSDGSYEPSRLTTEWESRDSLLRLRGSSAFVLDADVAELLVVAARRAEGITALVLVDMASPGVRVERTATVDATRRLFSVVFDDVVVAEASLLCEPGVRADEIVDEIVAIGAIAVACDAAGATERVLERAAQYANERVQFGKPIGSFQAVKHHCANMAIAVEASKAATHAATAALDGDPGSWATAASVTSSYVGPACAEACAVGMRVHGGIGYTWEHDSHLYLKRVKLDEVLFGSPSWHRRRLARALIDSSDGSEARS